MTIKYKADIFHFFNRYGVIYLLILSISLVFAISFSALSRRSYVSSAVVLLSGDSSSSALDSVGSFLGISGLQGDSMKNTIISIIKSNRMTDDIAIRFNLEKSKDTYVVDVGEMPGGLVIKIIGPSPELTGQIANFVIEDLDKINTELNISSSKPMVKVLDSANPGLVKSRNFLRNILVACFINILIISTHISLLSNTDKSK